MGVGAVFVCSLALAKLPVPQNPPQTQLEILAASLQPIVSFVVLGSIIIRKIIQSSKRVYSIHGSLCLDGLSIPFFSISSTTTVSLTNTLTYLSTNRSPDWLIGIRQAPTLDSKSPVSPVCATDPGTGGCNRTLEVASVVAESSKVSPAISEGLVANLFEGPGGQPAAAAVHSPLAQ